MDESVRSSYWLAAAIICLCRLPEVTRHAVGVRPGRVPMAKESDRTRRAVSSKAVRLPVAAVAVAQPGSSLDQRWACWEDLVPILLRLAVSRVIIERQEGLEARDSSVIHDALWKHRDIGRFTHEHRPPRNEPMLWVADIVAWSSSGNEDWRRRVQPLFNRRVL